MAKNTRDALEIELTVTVDFGEDYETVTMVDQQKIPFVDAAVGLRNSSFGMLTAVVLRAAARSPKVMKEILPFSRLLKFPRGI